MKQLRSSPASFCLGLAWIFVYFLMAWNQGSLHAGGNLLAGGVRTTVTNQFGHLTAAQFAAGEIWRPLTATFIHYSLIHLVMNLIGLWMLGPLLESWYGWSQYVWIYVVTGYGGNLIATLSKLFGPGRLPAFLLVPDHPSGGGSTVICGMVALLAVAGWRSRSQLGHMLWFQMVWVLVLTAILGLSIPNVDNLGHAGGTLMGLLIGLVEPALFRNQGRRRAMGFGIAGILAIGACGGAQYGFDRAEDRFTFNIIGIQGQIQAGSVALGHLARIGPLYQELGRRGPSGNQRLDLAGPPIRVSQARLVRELNLQIAQLDAVPTDLAAGPTGILYGTVLDLARRATTRAPSPNELARFDQVFPRLLTLVDESIRGRRALLHLVMSGRTILP